MIKVHESVAQLTLDFEGQPSLQEQIYRDVKSLASRGKSSAFIRDHINAYYGQSLSAEDVQLMQFKVNNPKLPTIRATDNL